MVQVPFQLRYNLTRWHRLQPYLTVSELARVLCLLFMLTCFLGGIFVNGWSWMWIPTLLLLGLFSADLIALFFNLLLQRLVEMDLLVEEKGLGFMRHGERWYCFLDGLTSVEQSTKGLWTICHWNGTRINIPVEAITEEQVAYLKAWVVKGRDPEVIKAVAERGKLIERLLNEQRGGKKDG